MPARQREPDDADAAAPDAVVAPISGTASMAFFVSAILRST
jgi:hypothetical protein